MSKTLTIPSDLSRLEEVVDVTEAFVREHVRDDEFVYRVALLTTEAVTNAMEHGNGLDTDKQVRLDLNARAEGVEVMVEDEGAGFDPDALRDPLAQENLLREGGRGVYLIEAMADEVHFEQGGRRIRMLLRWPVATDEQAR